MAQEKAPDASKCVISVSPWWSHFHRRSLLNAVKIGKIDCLSLVNSTTAAAVSYVKVHEDKLPPKEAKPLPVMFIDMGDYSMNVVIALVKKNYVQIVSYTYDDHLGGALFTAELIPYLFARTIEKYKIDPRKNPRAWIRFQDEAEKLKKTLSINPAVPFDVPCLMNDVDVNSSSARTSTPASRHSLPVSTTRSRGPSATPTSRRRTSSPSSHSVAAHASFSSERKSQKSSARSQSRLSTSTSASLRAQSSWPPSSPATTSTSKSSTPHRTRSTRRTQSTTSSSRSSSSRSSLLSRQRSSSQSQSTATSQ